PYQLVLAPRFTVLGPVTVLSHTATSAAVGATPVLQLVVKLRLSVLLALGTSAAGRLPTPKLATRASQPRRLGRAAPPEGNACWRRRTKEVWFLRVIVPNGVFSNCVHRTKVNPSRQAPAATPRRSKWDGQTGFTAAL